MMSCYAQISAEELEAREAQDITEHGEIIAALASGDGERAEQLMRWHIEMNCEELIAVLDARD
jgi:DNA-binding GntR family transcriptional regulator